MGVLGIQRLLTGIIDVLEDLSHKSLFKHHQIIEDRIAGDEDPHIHMMPSLEHVRVISPETIIEGTEGNQEKETIHSPLDIYFRDC
tara:strand:- start:184 stop:441 length:258 start_codon:yes stop_codon:yes gene_type:complete